MHVITAVGIPRLDRADAQERRRSMESKGLPAGYRAFGTRQPPGSCQSGHVREFGRLLLVALRDPRDVVMSCFMQPFVPVGQTTSAYLSIAGTVDEYAALMSMWRTVAPLLRNPWLEVKYEDMVEDLESVSRRVLEFLGVPWDANVLSFDDHARKKMVRSPTYADVTKPVFKTAVGRWRNYGKYLEPHLEKLQPFVKAFGYE
jgi:hypothetical protein